MSCLPPPPDVPYGDPGPSLGIRLLTRLRDSRRVWNIMGFLYNRGINGILTPLTHFIAGGIKTSGRALIVDVGAGRGSLSLAVAARNPEAHVIGIDYSINQVREARRYCAQQKVVNCSFKRCDAMDIPFQNESVDAAVSVGSIKHWPDARRGLLEIHRVLKPGSCLIVAETDREATDDALKDFVKRFRLRFVPDRLHFWGLRHVIFGQSFSKEELAGEVIAAGFRDIQCLRVPTCPYVIVKARKQEINVR